MNRKVIIAAVVVRTIAEMLLPDNHEALTTEKRVQRLVHERIPVCEPFVKTVPFL